MTINRRTLIALAASLAITPTASWAGAQYSWTFSNGNCVGATDDVGNDFAKGASLASATPANSGGVACGSGETNKVHSLTFDGYEHPGGTTDLLAPPQVVASAWASDNSYDTLGKALTKDDLVRWSGGLGVENRFEIEATNGPHALSNDGYVYELIMFEFDVPIALDLVSAGYAGDGDITVLRFAGGQGSTPDPEGVPYEIDGEGLTGTGAYLGTGTGWEQVGNWDLTTNTPADIKALGNVEASNKWIVAAHIAAFGDQCINDPNQQCVTWNDRVKIDFMKGTYEPPSREPGPGTPAPVPPTLWLSLIGLAWISQKARSTGKNA